MDGQDALLGADYLFTDNTRFLLTEFKYEKLDLKNEKKKPRRLVMCAALDEHKEAQSLSFDCHFIAWSEREYTRTVVFNSYYAEICNRTLFGADSLLQRETPLESSRCSADDFIDGFILGSVGVGYAEFEGYSSWLLSLESGGGDSIELMLDNPDSAQLEFLEFSSVQALKTWLDRNAPSPAPRYTPGPRFP